MNYLELQFLQAACEMVTVRQHLLTELGDYLAKDPLSYLRQTQHAEISKNIEFSDGKWRLVYSGFAAVIENQLDGRCLHFSYETVEDLQTVSSIELSRFVLMARSPWRVFTKLQNFLCTTPKPFTRHSACWDKSKLLATSLSQLGYLEEETTVAGIRHRITQEGWIIGNQQGEMT
jgi:hypothetical protein